MEMTYKRGDVFISVRAIEGRDKKPGVYIGTTNPNAAVKVASCGSQDKSEQLMKWLEYLFGISTEKPTFEEEGASDDRAR